MILQNMTLEYLSLEEKRGIDYIGGVCTVSLSSSLKPPNESKKMSNKI